MHRAMTIPGTIPRGKTTVHRGSNKSSAEKTGNTEPLRQSAAEIPKADNTSSQSTNAPQGTQNEIISRREYFRRLIPTFGKQVTKGIRGANSLERDVQELLRSKPKSKS